MDLLTLSIAKKYTDESILGTDGINKGDKGDKGDPGYTPIRGVDYWTEDDKNSIISEIDPAPPIVCEETGDVIAVNDSSDRLLKGLTLYGKTTQNGTPSPENPVELVSAGASGSIKVQALGGQLIPKQHNLERAGVTVSVDEDGTITFTGTTVGGFNYNLMDTSFPAGTYHMTWNRKGLENVNLRVFNFTTKVHMLNNKDGSFTSNGTDNIVIFVNSPTNIEFNGSIRPMLNAGETALPYEPYKGQTVTASTPNGLPGIPVSSGGNYTDENGQQWVCDEIDFAKGVYVKRVHKRVFNGTEAWSKHGATDGANVRYDFRDHYTPGTANPRCLSQYFKYAGINAAGAWMNDDGHDYAQFRIMWDFATVDDLKAFLSQKYAEGNPVTIFYIMYSPTETALSAEELAAFAALHSYKPNTTVHNDAGAGLAVEYVADTKNYIDQKMAAISAALLNA